MATLEVNNLNYIYTHEWTRKKQIAVKDLSFKVDRGECFGFLGLNGAGKTTTIKAILGLINPLKGSVIKINGYSHKEVKARSQVGYVPEQPYFYDHLTVNEIMYLYASLSGVPPSVRKEAVVKALKRVKLHERETSRMRTLSKGLTQRVAIAQAIVGDPALLILDEPFSGMDPIGRKEFRDLFLELKGEGKTLLLCSHILSDAEFLCDRGLILANGETKGIVDSKVENLEEIFTKAVGVKA
jgi:ABC-2 type transport system ATP-binding protein